MRKKLCKKTVSPRMALLLLASILLIGQKTSGAATFSSGDLFVSLHTGQVLWYSATGTLLGTLTGTNTGQAKGMGFDSSGNLYVAHWYQTDLAGGNNVDRFDSSGNLLGAWGSGYNCNPSSIVFDTLGHAFVGQSDCTGNLLKFSLGGALLTTFAPAVEVRGTERIDLANDQCTMFYTSESVDIKRFDVCSGTQLPNFNAEPLPDSSSGAFAVRVLPNGSGVLVADFSSIVRLDAFGQQVQTYNVDSESPKCWMGLALTLDGSAFWASNWCTGFVFKFDIVTGIVLQTINTGTGAGIKAVAVAPGPPPTTPPGPPFTPPGPPPSTPPGPPPSTPPGPPPTPPGSPAPVVGWMTGGGSVFTAAGLRVTHGFELHCNASQGPNNLEVNWGGDRFHLDQLTSVTCTFNPAISPNPPPASFNTLTATGTGSFDGQAGATIQLTFTDAGEPGVNDTATMTITDASGKTVLTVSGSLTFGNQQAHK